MSVLVRTHIVSTPDVCFGKPRIDGHRIRVQDVEVQRTYHELTPEQIAEEYELTLGQVHAALSYYYDHRAEIDDAIRVEAAAIDVGARRNPPKIRKLLGG